MNWKKVVSMLLVGVMTLSMTACGGKDAGTSAAGTESANAGTSAGTEATAGDQKLVVWTLSQDLVDFGERYQEKTESFYTSKRCVYPPVPSQLRS